MCIIFNHKYMGELLSHVPLNERTKREQPEPPNLIGASKKLRFSDAENQAESAAMRAANGGLSMDQAIDRDSADLDRRFSEIRNRGVAVAKEAKEVAGIDRQERSQLEDDQMGREFRVWERKFKVGDIGTYTTKDGKDIVMQVMGPTEDGEGVKLMNTDAKASKEVKAFNIAGDSLASFRVTTENRNTVEEEQASLASVRDKIDKMPN